MAVLDPEITERIRRLLRGNLRGLTVTDLTSRLDMNRNLVAKNLDMLLVAGQVEMRFVGATKVYTLAQRVPIAAMLEFSSDCIIVTDADRRIVQVNEPLLRLIEGKRDMLIGKTGEETEDPIVKSLLAKEPSEEGTPPRETTREICVPLAGKDRCFSIKEVPTVFEDGSNGATFIIEDITERKIYERNMEFLARTSATFADMGDEEDIYQYIVDRIAELEPKAHIVIMSINPDTKMTSVRAFAGDEGLNRILLEHFGGFIQNGVSMEKAPEAWIDISQGTLVKGPKSLYVQTYRMFPEEVCNEVQERLAIGNSYTIGCTCRMGIYGNITIRYRYDNDVRNKKTVEAFVRQAGVALQRRHMREKLRKAEERIRELERGSMVPDGSLSLSKEGSISIQSGTETPGLNE